MWVWFQASPFEDGYRPIAYIVVEIIDGTRHNAVDLIPRWTLSKHRLDRAP